MALCVFACMPCWSGCAAVRPLKGVPARYLPYELKAPQRSGRKTIDLSLLRQTPPREYLIDAGDVLAVYIEGILGRREEVPPVFYSQKNDVAPSLGYPIPVRDDGTISLPLVGPINVRGKTLPNVEQTIRTAYTVTRQILQPGRDRILISLQKPRTYRVLVIRQEAGANSLGGGGGGGAGQFNLGTAKRGSGKVVSLNAYDNDVLHALAETGGLPGLDADNTVYIHRSERNQFANATMPTNTQFNQTNPTQPIPRRTGPTPMVPGSSGTSLPLPGQYRTPNPAVPPAPVQPQRSFPPMPTPPGVARPPAHSPTTTDALRSPFSIQRTSAVTNNRGDFGHSFTSGGVAQAAFQQPTYPIPAQGGYGMPANSNFGHGGPVVGQMPDPSMAQFPSPGYPSNFSPAPSMVNGSAWGGQPYDQPFGGDQTMDNERIIKIPIRLSPGQTVNFTERDIILKDGDIVFIESRDTEIFYTGGLLGGGQYTLPRDYDLDVVAAISIAQSQRGGGGRTGRASALNQDVTISASDVVVLRQMPNGTQVPIKVNLYDAIRYPEERILIQPGDFVFLQYTPMEAVGAFFERHILESALFGIAAAQFSTGRSSSN